MHPHNPHTHPPSTHTHTHTHHIPSGGDSWDTPLIALRRELARSPSMRAAYAEGFRAAGLDIDAPRDVAKVAAMDIYS